jgi:hypothetical protein
MAYYRPRRVQTSGPCRTRDQISLQHFARRLQGIRNNCNSVSIRRADTSMGVALLQPHGKPGGLHPIHYLSNKLLAVALGREGVIAVCVVG